MVGRVKGGRSKSWPVILLVVAVGCAVGGTAWTYHQKIEKMSAAYTLMVREGGLEIQRRGSDLKKLAAEMNALPGPSGGAEASTGGGAGWRQFAARVAQDGEALERYGDQMSRQVSGSTVQIEKNEFGMLLPQAIQKIKEQGDEIKKLQLMALQYQSRIQSMEMELNGCMGHVGNAENSDQVLMPQECREKYESRIEELESQLRGCQGGSTIQKE